MSDINVSKRVVVIGITSRPKAIRVNAGTQRAITARQHPVVVRPSNPVHNAVVREPQAVLVDTGGKQGLPGPAGPAGPAGGVDVEKMAAMPLGGGRVVRSTGANLAEYADCRFPDHGDDTLGVTRGAAAAGTTVRIANGNEMQDPAWTWAPQQPIYLGENGLMTQTPPDPAGGAAFSQEVAVATAPDAIMVRIGPPIYFY